MDKSARGQNPFNLRFVNYSPLPEGLCTFGLYSFPVETFRKDSCSQAPRSYCCSPTAMLERSAAQQLCQPPSKNTAKAKLAKTHNPRVTPRSRYYYQFLGSSYSSCRLTALGMQRAWLAPCKVWPGWLAEAQHCLLEPGNITNSSTGHQA